MRWSLSDANRSLINIGHRRPRCILQLYDKEVIELPSHLVFIARPAGDGDVFDSLPIDCIDVLHEHVDRSDYVRGFEKSIERFLRWLYSDHAQLRFRRECLL